ncbi:MAG: SusD/RagB family nutrient-binding outer membrane lipoprotein [Bacteroidales bacterium]|nr:SusD/RagB family nutrient-binding outer membrane lipoprotein [Bacteroidales bacterium]
MKKRIFYKIGVFILVALIFSSCEKWIDEDINIDPDAPTEVSMDLLMPVIQARVAFNMMGGNDMARTQGIWMQYLTGIARQSQAEGAYTLRAGDVNNLWGDVYAGALMDIKQLHGISQGSSPNFDGAADVLQAIAIISATDVWGDVPYSEALLGKENLTPAFDTQQSIYQAVQSLLDNAITNLSATENLFPLGGDIIYGGNTEAWVKAAWSLKARYALHLSKVDANAYADALTYLNNGFTSNAENMYYYYDQNNLTNGNPLWLFMQDRGDVVMGQFFIDLMNANTDPRLPVYAEPIADTIFYNNDTIIPGSYFGSPAGEPYITASLPGSAIAASNAPTPIITYPEVLLIKAEAQYGTGDETGAKASLKLAVAASLEERGVEGGTWLTDLETTIDGLSGNDLYKEIILQKYYALVYSTEIFNDFRRTNNEIGLSPNPVAATQEIPRRYPYATDPVTFNPNTPSGVGIWNRVWWDN